MMNNDVLIPMNLQLLASDGKDEVSETTADNAIVSKEEGKDKSDTQENVGSDKDTKSENSKRVAKYTDDDVDRLINQKFAKWQRDHQSKIDEAQKLAKMNEAERQAYETKKLKEELEELKREKTLNEMGKISRTILSEKNINLDDDMIAMLITDEAESTKANITKFSEMFDKAVNHRVNELVKSKTPKAGNTAKITKKEILEVKNANERRKLIAENLDLFK